MVPENIHTHPKEGFPSWALLELTDHTYLNYNAMRKCEVNKREVKEDEA